MELSRRAELVATSHADDLALRVLADVAQITQGEDARIVGGHMTALLLTAFPVAGVPARRTRDADAAITTELAGSGVLHDRLLALGYTDTAGNHYEREVPELADPDGPPSFLQVDLLVPSFNGRFAPRRHGGRIFDAAPGLEPALLTPPILIHTGATLRDGTVLEFTVAVPPVEYAVVIKAIAYGARRAARDAEDLYRLLAIATAYPPQEIGGWRLDGDDLSGSRRDAAAHLHALARGLRARTDVDVPIAEMAALIADRVSFAR